MCARAAEAPGLRARGQRESFDYGDGTARLWHTDTGQPSGAPLTGHTGGVHGVALSPDGHRLASVGADTTVRLWNADISQPVGAPLTGHTDLVYSAAFSPDGHRLASASRDDTVRYWPTIATPEMLSDKPTTTMSHQQWREWMSPDPDIEDRELCPGSSHPGRLS